mmetsp:Transcript_23206/g.54327  ORF Transcript_23206/g.54327 Transcript_23206/m.54327 type:complete len:417 (-) Transcript_23206:591-1841(-)
MLPSCRRSAISAPLEARCGLAWRMALMTLSGTSAAAAETAADSGWRSMTIKRLWCSSSTCAATSPAPPEHSSAARAISSETPSDCRRFATRDARGPALLLPDDGIGRTLLPAGATLRRDACEAWPSDRSDPLLPRLPEAALELLLDPSLASLPTSTEIEVEPSACFRASAGRRHVGHVVASRIVLAQLSRHAAWKMCEHLGRGRMVSPGLISSWQTVQILSSGGMSRQGTPAGDASALPWRSSLDPTPAPAPSATPPCVFNGTTCTSELFSSSRAAALRMPQSHWRRALPEVAEGTARMQMSASWKPSGRLPGPTSSSLSEVSRLPVTAFISAPSSLSMLFPRPASLAAIPTRRWARARDHLERSRNRAKQERIWTSPATSKWNNSSVSFTSSLMRTMRCNELIQSAESKITRMNA